MRAGAQGGRSFFLAGRFGVLLYITITHAAKVDYTVGSPVLVPLGDPGFGSNLDLGDGLPPVHSQARQKMAGKVGTRWRASRRGCGRGGTQAIGNKTILPAWARGRGGGGRGRSGRQAVYAPWAAICCSNMWRSDSSWCCNLCGEGWAGLGWQVLWAAKKQGVDGGPHPWDPSRGCCCLVAKGATGTGTDDEVGA